MSIVRLSVVAGTLALAACAGPGGPPPSLQPRKAEGIDPRLAVVPVNAPPPLSQGLAPRLAALVQQARTGNAAFQSAAAEAERLAAVAGPARSESWITAQEALSAASAARLDTTKALSDIDAIGADALQSKGTIGPMDLAAIDKAAKEVGAVDDAQAARLAAISRRLGL